MPVDADGSTADVIRRRHGLSLRQRGAAADGQGHCDEAAGAALRARAGGRLELVAAEWFKPDADQDVTTDHDRPTLFDRAFDGPMLGHGGGMPIHFDLHVWLWKRNPSGIFASWNPAVVCPATEGGASAHSGHRP